jgi:undecaprenyl-diphosphatase
MALLGLFAFALLLTLRMYAAGIFILVALLAGVGAAEALRLTIGRPGPPETTVDWLQPGTLGGFPGGSALSAAVVYLTLALVLAPHVPSVRAGGLLIAAGVLLAFLTGVSRFYLGLQFLSDMLAAWIGGLVWALVCREVSRRWVGHKAPLRNR